jgi:four helix bundle protein
MKDKSYHEKPKSRETQNHNNKKKSVYDLEERTYEFARRINNYVNELPRLMSNQENGRQLIRSGGSVGANYIEANESLSKKDFQMRVKISKKESKESRFWLRLTEPDKDQIKEKNELIQECTELMKIFASILEKTKKSKDTNF